VNHSRPTPSPHTKPGAAPAGRVILASAGTGKTFTLTNRIMQLLAQGEDPGSIIATTFTRKAAGEILGRLLERLARGATEPDQLAVLRAHVDPHMTAESCAAMLDSLVQSIDRLSIVTIDALFVRLAGLFGLDAGLAPNWSLADESQLAELFDTALTATLNENDPATLRLVMTQLQQGDAARSIRDHASRLIRASLDTIIATRHVPQAWLAVGQNPPAPLDGPSLQAAISSLRGTYAEVPLTKAGTPNSSFTKALDRDLEQIGSGRFKEFLKAGIATKLVRGETQFSRAEIPLAMTFAYAPLIRHATAVILAQFADRNRAAQALGTRFDAAFTLVKHRAGLLGFDDIPRLLHNISLTGELDRLYYRLDARVRHLLLDEFQDTAIDQFRLLAPIIDELLAGDGDSATDPRGSRSVLCVGDVKQSLYAWRGAEPALLPHLLDRWPSMAAATLVRNFRSSPVILAATDAILAPVDRLPMLAGSGGTARFAQHYSNHVAAEDKLPGSARVLVAPEPSSLALQTGTGKLKKSVTNQRRATVVFAADRAAALASAHPTFRIAILLRTNKWMAEILHNLRSRGIDAVKEGGNPLTDSPAVAAVVSLFQACAHPGDTAAIYHVASGPLGRALGLDPDAEADAAQPVLAKLRKRLADEGPAALITDLRDQLANNLGTRSMERFEQLVDQAISFEAAGLRDPDRLVRELSELGVDQPGRARVRVTTIHKAKGLEFDAVIIPELDRPWSLRSDAVILTRDDNHPTSDPTVASLRPDELIENLDPTAATATDHARQSLIYQELCSLYVALTRAKQVLEIIIPPGPAVDADEAAKVPNAARLIHSALCPDVEAQAGTVLWTAPNSDPLLLAPAETQPGTPADADAPAFGPAVHLRSPISTPVHRQRRVSPSSLEGTSDGQARTVRLSELLRLPEANTAGRAAGSVLHAWFETLEWADQPAPDEATLRAAAIRLGAQPGELDELLARFRAALTGPRIAARLSKSWYTSRGPANAQWLVRREWPFAVRWHDHADPASPRAAGSLLSGFMDRVVLTAVNNRVIAADVLDYKTDAVDPRGPGPDDRARFDQRVDHYRPQLQAYRSALTRLLDLPAASISAALLFTRCDEVVEIAPIGPR
jgi:ATP-dependent helicase/nuclease subunit A